MPALFHEIFAAIQQNNSLPVVALNENAPHDQLPPPYVFIHLLRLCQEVSSDSSVLKHAAWAYVHSWDVYFDYDECVQTLVPLAVLLGIIVLLVVLGHLSRLLETTQLLTVPISWLKLILNARHIFDVLELTSPNRLTSEVQIAQNSILHIGRWPHVHLVYWAPRCC